MRRLMQFADDEKIDMLWLLEHLLPATFDDYELRILPDSKLRGVEGLTDLSKPVVSMPECTYNSLYHHEPRARFTAAHEVGHLFMHSGKPLHYARTSKKYDPELDPEWQANVFAAAFLMPAAGLRRCSTIEQAMEKFGVGYRAVVWRGKTIGHKWQNFKKKGTNEKR